MTDIKEKIERIALKFRKEFLFFRRDKQKLLVEAYKETAKEIRNILGLHANNEGHIDYISLEALMWDIRRTIRELAQWRDKELQNGTGKAALMSIAASRTMISAVGDTAASAELEAASEVIYRKTIENIYNFVHPEDKLQLSDRLWRLDNGARAKVTEIIEGAAAQGQSAHTAVQKLIRGGEQVPKDLLAKMNINSTTKIGRDVFEIFTPKGEQNIVRNATRLMRNELSRANREAFINTNKEISAVIGTKWNLSPSHPRPDICDTYAGQDKDGLGTGGYKEGNYPPVPAHIECLCFDTPVFDWEK